MQEQRKPSLCGSFFLLFIDKCIDLLPITFNAGTAPAYSAEIFRPVNQGRTTRRSKFKLEFPFRKSNTGQKCLSYLGPKIWNSLPSELKSSNNINTFKHKIKKKFSKIYRKGKMTYMSSIKTLHYRSRSCLVLYTTSCIENTYKSVFPFNLRFFRYTDTSKGTIMEIRSA